MSEGRVISTGNGGLIWLFVMQEKQANSHTLVKFCGITRSADAATALGVGADALGMVFFQVVPALSVVSRRRKYAVSLMTAPLKKKPLKWACL